MSMVNPYEGLPTGPKKPATFWVAAYTYADGSADGPIGVYSSEEKAMAGAVRFIKQNGWPAIDDFKFTAFELNTSPAPAAPATV